MCIYIYIYIYIYIERERERERNDIHTDRQTYKHQYQLSCCLLCVFVGGVLRVCVFFVGVVGKIVVIFIMFVGVLFCCCVFVIRYLLFSVCDAGTFGSDCTAFCHCQDKPCDYSTGQCAAGCQHNWTGQHCDGTDITTNSLPVLQHRTGDAF